MRLGLRLLPRSARPAIGLALLWVVALSAAGCDGGTAAATPPIRPGSSASPREVNIVAKDYLFIPAVLELVPGETVLIHLINGGLVTHEVVIGDEPVQDAWESAEGATANAPPGPTPLVVVPSGVGGLRVVVLSGQRQDVLYTAPLAGRLIVGCHIPGHYAKGMHVPVRFVTPGG